MADPERVYECIVDSGEGPKKGLDDAFQWKHDKVGHLEQSTY